MHVDATDLDPRPPAATTAAEADAEGERKENPYVSVLAKKLRGLRKKMDRIKALEEQQASGKASQNVASIFSFLSSYMSHPLLFPWQKKTQALDEAQLTLLQSKEGIERLFKEVETLRTQVRVYAFIFLMCKYRRVDHDSIKYSEFEFFS